MTHFHQTYITNALWARDESFTFWGQKVKGQVYSEYNMLEAALLAFIAPVAIPYSMTCG